VIVVNLFLNQNQVSMLATEVVNRLIRHGSMLTQTAEGYLPPAAKEEVENDITLQIENFLKTMAKDPNGNCKELESRVMKAVEKQFYALYGDRSPELMRKILDEKIENMRAEVTLMVEIKVFIPLKYRNQTFP